MSCERSLAHASIDPAGELSLHGGLTAAIVLTLTDPEPGTLDDGTPACHQPDISCLLRPSEAITLARTLTALAHSAWAEKKEAVR